jgi:hypothetical protein
MTQPQKPNVAIQVVIAAAFVCIGLLVNQEIGSHKFVKTNEGLFFVNGVTATHTDPDGYYDEITIFLDRNNVIRKVEEYEYFEKTDLDDDWEWPVVTDSRKAQPGNLWRYDNLISDDVKKFKEYRRPKPAAPTQNNVAISKRR